MSVSYFDELETRSPDARESDLFGRLPDLLANAKSHSTAYARILADVDPQAISSRAALAGAPVTRKSGLVELQSKTKPFGGLNTADPSAYAMLLTSPGPLYEPEADRPDYWRVARALHAAGIGKGDIVHNSFSYHLSPGAWMLHSGARAIGCAVVPAGVGNTEAQVRAIADLRPTAYVGIPDFLKVLIEKADELGVDASCITKGLVSGAALPGSLRDWLNERGVDVLQCYATGDLGLIAYESSAMEGMIVDEDLIVEIVRPGTGDPVSEGEVGEVVVTSFNPDYPMIRFGTGDLSAVLSGVSPCGRTNMRLKGWMGRADQTAKVKGLFVHPGQVDQVGKRHPEIGRVRLVITRENEADAMTLQCESAADDESGLMELVAETLKSLVKVTGRVELVPPDSLPNDGKIIDDQRSYD